MQKFRGELTNCGFFRGSISDEMNNSIFVYGPSKIATNESELLTVLLLCFFSPEEGVLNKI